MTETPETPETPGRPVGFDEVVAAAAAERRAEPATEVEVADRADRYDQMMQLATLLDDAGEQVRQWSGLGAEVLGDDDVAASAELSPRTHATAEEEVRAATTGKRGLLTRSIELDADALVLRATVLTYRWIDELQSAAYRTLGSIAGRAIGYLAPEVALGGAIVSAGLIETDALDRDGVAAYLNELAEANPELMDHATSGGGGLLDGLRMRAMLTAGVREGEEGRRAAAGGLRAMGVDPFPAGFAEALRDSAGGLTAPPPGAAAPAMRAGAAPRGLTELMSALEEATSTVVLTVAPSRYVVLLTGTDTPVPGDGQRLRLVGGDGTAYAAAVVRAVEEAVGDDADARVMLVGAGSGGAAAAEIAAHAPSSRFVVDQVLTAGAPSAHVPRIPEPTRVLSLEDRADPIALLGSLVNAGTPNRVTVVFDAGSADDASPLVTGARAADAADHPGLRAELDRLREAGFLAT